MSSGGNRGEIARGRVPALDGLRALAVIAVLLFHAQFSWAKGGFLGVSAFFTLSGFLITSLLLHDRLGTTRGRLRSFWARRARRLLPAALVTLFGVTAFAATVATPDQLRVLRGDVFAALGYVANWRFYVSGQSYAELFRAPSPVLPPSPLEPPSPVLPPSPAPLPPVEAPPPPPVADEPPGAPPVPAEPPLALAPPDAVAPPLDDPPLPSPPTPPTMGASSTVPHARAKVSTPGSTTRQTRRFPSIARTFSTRARTSSC